MSSSASRAGWLAALGLACFASTALVRRFVATSELPERMHRCVDDLQRRLYA